MKLRRNALLIPAATIDYRNTRQKPIILEKRIRSSPIKKMKRRRPEKKRKERVSRKMTLCRY